MDLLNKDGVRTAVIQTVSPSAFARFADVCGNVPAPLPKLKAAAQGFAIRQTPDGRPPPNG